MSFFSSSINSSNRLVRENVLVVGIVQGVGFRPFVYNLANSLDLTGFVSNNAAGVELAIQGSCKAVDDFFYYLQTTPPPLAFIQKIERTSVLIQSNEQRFIILSSKTGTKRTLISPDAAVCKDCLFEMRNFDDRRYRYPFINCTNCGPRYTIIKDLPYDRSYTTMASFIMCADCQIEYDDPMSRRFHAQPNACSICGPRLCLVDQDGIGIFCTDPVAAVIRVLHKGGIVAIKGLGGFHLVADAMNEEAINKLRHRKHRDEKPFAIMVSSLKVARVLVKLDFITETIFMSRECPIVLAPMRVSNAIVPSVNPRNRFLGVMLPYTPLHYLLIEEEFDALVMTSANFSNEPICLDNQESVDRIGGQNVRGGIVDFFLFHDRDIYLRGDDSIVRVIGGKLRQIRRSRGFVPSPILLPEKLVPEGCPPILATGAQLKNTICLLRGREAFLSQHIGNLNNLETLKFFKLTINHFQQILEAEAEIIACDLHPDYLSSQWALSQDLPVIRVQHHHAHTVAVMAEAGIINTVLSLSLDGTGYSSDYNIIWGGELLLTELHTYYRLGTLFQFKLPGGEKAIKENWRIGLSVLLEVFGESISGLKINLLEDKGQYVKFITQMMKKKLNSPFTSSLGRLFDSVAAIVGLRWKIAYEGQAAIELEQILDLQEKGAYPFSIFNEGNLWILDWRPAITILVEEISYGIEIKLVSARFHRGLIEVLTAWVLCGAKVAKLNEVCFGGGCFMNAQLLYFLSIKLERAGLKVYTPALVPVGDGGVALGQALAAAGAWAKGLLGRGTEVVLGSFE